MYMKRWTKPKRRVFKDPMEKMLHCYHGRTTWKFIQRKPDEMYENDIIYLYSPKEETDTGIRKVVNGKLERVSYVPKFPFGKDKTVDY